LDRVWHQVASHRTSCVTSLGAFLFERGDSDAHANLTVLRRQPSGLRDNYGTHKHPKVQAWLAKNPRIVMHFTPTSGSWLNMVEIFFGIITRQAIRRGSFDSVRELIDAIRAFIDGWNDRCEPFIWTKDADTILAKAKRKPTSDTRH
jgi:hypothetical protein